MNNGMRYGLVWDLAPRHYNDSVDEPLTRPLAGYVSELIRIRKQYADLLFYGRFNDNMGATVQGGGPNIRLFRFQVASTQNDSRACASSSTSAMIRSPSPSASTAKLARSPSQLLTNADTTAVLPVQIVIPAHQLAVVVKR